MLFSSFFMEETFRIESIPNDRSVYLYRGNSFVGMIGYQTNKANKLKETNITFILVNKRSSKQKLQPSLQPPFSSLVFKRYLHKAPHSTHHSTHSTHPQHPPYQHPSPNLQVRLLVNTHAINITSKLSFSAKITR